MRPALAGRVLQIRAIPKTNQTNQTNFFTPAAGEAKNASRWASERPYLAVIEGDACPALRPCGLFFAPPKTN